MSITYVLLDGNSVDRHTCALINEPMFRFGFNISSTRIRPGNEDVFQLIVDQ